MQVLRVTAKMKAHALWDDLRDDIVKNFWIFHSENPHIYLLYLRYAREARARRAYYSINAITERIRWHVNFEMFVENEAAADDFRINSSWGSCYARLLYVMYPHEFEGFFQYRCNKYRHRFEVRTNNETQPEMNT